jgi:hypothetical protein
MHADESVQEAYVAQTALEPVVSSTHAYYFSPLTSLFTLTSEPIGHQSIGHYLQVPPKVSSREIVLPEEIRVNYAKKERNPLYGKTVAQCSLLGESPLIITQQEPNLIYYLDTIQSNSHKYTVLQRSAVLNDASTPGMPASAIVTVAPMVGVGKEARSSIYYVCVPVLGHNAKKFGDPGSGFALIKKDVQQRKEMVMVDGAPVEQVRATKIFMQTLDAVMGGAGNRAYPCESSSAENPVTIHKGTWDFASDHIEMYWDGEFNRLYIGFSVTTGANNDQQQGACALLVAKVIDDKLSIEPIVATSHMQESIRSPFMAYGPHASASVHHITRMQTSLGGTYLVGVGGNGAPEDTRRSVWAFPIIDKRETSHTDEKLLKNEHHGRIAGKNSEYVERYHIFGNRSFGRMFIDQPAQPDDMLQADDPAVSVGGGALLPGDIDAIVSMGDSVFVAVRSPNSTTSTIFYSQALFDGRGAIMAWMPWRIAFVAREQVLGMRSDINKVTLTLLVKTGKELHLNLAELKESYVEDSVWHQQLYKTIKAEYEACKGGINDIALFGEDTPGLCGNCRSSMLVLSGYKKVLCAQQATGQLGELLKQSLEIGKVYSTESGKLGDTIDASTLVISGGDLEYLTAINTSCVVTDGVDSWLVVGGTGGIAVLASCDGKGWSASRGIEAQFKNLASFSFKKIGDYHHVKKVWSAADGTLYILTKDGLEALKLSPALVAGDQPAQSISMFNGASVSKKVVCNDVLISRSCIIIGTSLGIWYASYGSGHSELVWQRVQLPEGDTSVATLNMIYRDTLDSGNIYVVAHSLTHAKTRLYRFALVKDTIHLIRDSLLTDSITGIAQYSTRRYGACTDGSVVVSTFSGEGKSESNIIFEQLNVSGVKYANGISGKQESLSREKARSISSVIRDPFSGIWIVAGDFGLMFIAHKESGDGNQQK